MAKGILKLFGGLSILAGLLTLLAGLFLFQGQPGAFAVSFLPIGASLLVAGAPLLGFAQVIELLERIANNTSTTPRA